MKPSPRLTVIAALFIACIPGIAHAEAALADLIFMLPMIIIIGFYQILMGIYWWLIGATVLVTAWRIVTGREFMGWLFGDENRAGLLYEMSDESWFRSPPRFVPLHVTLCICTALATLYIFLCSVFISPEHLRIPKPEVVKATPIPVDTDARIIAPSNQLPNPAGGLWPQRAGYIDFPILAQGGKGKLVVYNNLNPSGIYIKLCNPDVYACQGLRHAYLAPNGSAMWFENLPDGDYEFRFREIAAPPYPTANSRRITVKDGKADIVEWNIPRQIPAWSEESKEPFFAIPLRDF